MGKAQGDKNYVPILFHVFGTAGQEASSQAPAETQEPAHHQFWELPVPTFSLDISEEDESILWLLPTVRERGR